MNFIFFEIDNELFGFESVIVYEKIGFLLGRYFTSSFIIFEKTLHCTSFMPST